MNGSVSRFPQKSAAAKTVFNTIDKKLIVNKK